MRFTKQYMVENFASVSDERDLLSLYLYDSQNGRTPDATEHHMQDGERTRVQLYRATSAHGGYVVIREGSNTRIGFIDDETRRYHENYSPYVLGLKTCLERLTIARNRAAEAEHVSQIR